MMMGIVGVNCIRTGMTRPPTATMASGCNSTRLANCANLVELHPDAIVAVGGRVIPVLMQLTPTIPIIIPGATDPVGTGYVESLTRPGGNVTGFANNEFSVIGKMLATLKEIAPGTSRIAMIYNP